MYALAALTEEEENDVRRLVTLHKYAVPIFAAAVVGIGLWFWMRKGKT